MLLAAILILNIVLPTDVFAETEAQELNEVTLYVSATGNDETGDGTSSNPYATISKAEAVIEEDTNADQGRIIISGEVAFSAATHTKMITITGDGQNATKLSLGGATQGKPTAIQGPTTMEAINLAPVSSSYNSGLLESGQYELIFGTDVQVLRFNGNFRVGSDLGQVGTQNGTGETPTLIIDSLSHNNLAYSSNNIRIGSTGGGSWMDGAMLTVNGGTNNEINIHRPTQFSKDVNLVFNGGTVTTLTTSISSITGTYKFGKALQIIFNNGMRPITFDKEKFDNIPDDGGKWYIYGDNTGGSLATTDIAGIFLVNGTNVTAKATNMTTNEVYYADCGSYLRIPAGEYNVTYIPKEDDVIRGIAVRFVSATGDDKNDGLTKETAFKSISKAEASLEEVFESNAAGEGLIFLSGSLDFTAATHTKMITITGDGNSSTVLNIAPVNGSTINIVGPTTFENIALTASYNVNQGQLQTQQSELVIGEGVTFSGKLNSYFRIGAYDAVAGNQQGTGTVPTFMFDGVTHTETSQICSVRIGTGYGNWMNGANITINGGKVADINFHRATQFSQNVNLVINGGTIGTIQKQTNAAFTGTYQFHKALQIVFNNGSRNNVTTFDKASIDGITDVGGKWYIYSDNTGGTLSVTETAGKFKVNGDYYAIATLKDDDTKVYYGKPGDYLTIPAGEYNVTYSAQNPEGGLNEAIIYVSAEGSDDTGDGTEGNPYATISKAEQVINDKIVADIGKIIVMDEVVFENTVAHTKMITITGATDARLILNQFVRIYGPTTFENITLHRSQVNNAENLEYFVTERDNLVFGEGVKVTRDSALSSIMRILVGDYYAQKHTDGEKPRFEVNSISGAAVLVHLGFISSPEKEYSIPGADIILNGGTLNQINVAPQTGITYSDDVNITVNDGTLENGVLSTKTATFNGAFQYVINDGTGNTKVKSDVQEKIVAAKGSWYMYDDVDEETKVTDESLQYKGCKLETTATAGTFDVVNGSTLESVYAVATYLKNPSIIYYSSVATQDAKGTLTVPEGEWVVTYTKKKPDWYCTGSEVVFNKTVDNFKLQSITSLEFEDQIIIGWKNGETLAADGKFGAGTRLKAIYASNMKKENFNINDIELRLDDGALRFEVDMNMNLYDELDAEEYGIIAIKAADVPYKDGGDIEIGGNYNGKEPVVIKANNIYSYSNNIMAYTLCLTDIEDTAEAYNTDYMIRGYVKFTDQNHNVRVIYTDFEQSSVKATVEKMLADGNVDQETKNTLESKYVPVIQEGRAALAKSYTGTTISGSVFNDGIGSSFNVKEITINKVENSSNSEELTLVQLSDLHINNLSKKDFADNRQTVFSFYRTRRFGLNAEFAQVAERALKYADAVADQVIVTGDTLDNLNEGALDVQKRLIWSRYPNIISTTGNHEWMEVTVGSMAEVLTKEQAKARLQEDATHDVLYSSKVQKGVMIIQMDNAALNDGRGYGYGYEESQITRLAADLEIAKNNGYTVLIFQHVPLQTDEGKFNEIRTPESTPANTKPTGEINKRMIQLIKDNSDVIKGIFCGHEHDSSESTVGGIPQYLADGNHKSGGYAVKITVK